MAPPRFSQNRKKKYSPGALYSGVTYPSILSFCLRDYGSAACTFGIRHMRSSPEPRPPAVTPCGTCAIHAFGGGPHPFLRAPALLRTSSDMQYMHLL